jgi:hypothetical protein
MVPHEIIEVHARPVSVIEVHSKGLPGPPGKFQWRDVFNPDEVYIPGDIVVYNGKLYFNFKPSIPAALPTDSNYWTALGGSSYRKTKHREDIPAGVEPVIEHGLGTMDIDVTVMWIDDEGDAINAWVAWRPVDENHVQFFFERPDLNPQLGSYYATILTGNQAD